MSKFLQRVLVCGAMFLLPTAIFAQQLTNADFEDWSAAQFDGNPQPVGWNASNVTQFGFKFNFAHKETGHNGGYCMMVQDQDVGAAGITETSPGYFSLGHPWVYVPSLTQVSSASAGDYGGINWTYRPDSMTVWIKRTGNNTSKEDFYLLYYAWAGTAQSNKYKAKNGSCATTDTFTDEESDIRQELDGNECGTSTPANPGQICEGMWREKKTYANWTKITVPIYYFNNNVPQKMNIIFSASNYPNFRANSGLYAGNSLYVDDIELVYSSKIQQLFINDKEWKGFDPNSEDIQYYSLGETATEIPTIEARRGVGSLTNARGKTVPFSGRVLSGSEITVTPGDLVSQPTLITVRAEDGSSTTTYKIQFQKAKSKNANLASISYALGTDTTAVPGFVPGKYNYEVELPYGTTQKPVVTYVQQEDGQTVTVTQPTSVSGSATIEVKAADTSVKKIYVLTFKVGQLKDVTLQDIRVNNKSIPGFSPSQAVYKVSLPTNTTQAPIVQPISAYPDGEQTITVSVPTLAQIQAGGQQAQAQITVSAPGATTSKVYKLNFKIEASTYSYLASLALEGDRIESVNPSLEGDVTALAFEPDLTTYYINLLMGTKYLPRILYERGDEYQTITIDSTRFANGNGTVSINVMAGNNMDQTIYKLVFYAPKSADTNLKGVLINGEQMEGFDPAKTSYSDTLEIGESFPTIAPILGDYQTYTMSSRKSGNAETTTITVMAGNGDTKSYNFTYYSQTYTDNRLANLVVEGFSLCDRNGDSIAFDAEVKEYWVNLPMGTAEIPTITATLRNAQYQDTTVTPLTDLNGTYKITVKPLSGAGRTYTIHFSVAVSKNAALAMIFLDGDSLKDFDPNVRDYVHTVEKGESVPVVSWTRAEEVQTVAAVTNKNTMYLTVTAGDKKTKRVYSIRFKFPASDNTQLLDIKLKYADRSDTISMKYSHKFKGDSLDYSVDLEGPTCPQIFPVTAAGQKVAVAAPYANGTATIKVISEDGSEETKYTIEFTKAIVEAVQLDRIYYNGKLVDANFDPKKTHYVVEDYADDDLPVITYLPEDANARVFWKNTTDSLIAYIRVTDGDNEGVYDVVFNRSVSENDSLIGIYANGVLIDGFTPATTSYTYELAAGQAYPALSYQVAEKAQVVFFGQLAEGKWGITVKSAKETTKEYTVQYNHAKFDDADLEGLQVAGNLITDFDPNVTKYPTGTTKFNLGNGEEMPQVTATPKADKNQKVLIYAPNNHEQHVLVVAENGTTQKEYIIEYTRVQSANCKLAALYVEGKPLATFHPDTLHYTYPLTSADTVVKNVYPVGQLDNQVITTTFGKPGETTTIKVDAQDGLHSTTYTIDFPITLNNNTKLGSLMINGDDQDVNKTEYSFTLPFDTVHAPYSVEFTKADSTQLIQFIEAPATGVTKIIVTAENNDSRTYTIRYTIAEPDPKENVVTKIDYSYTDANGASQTGTIANPKKGENIVDLPFGCTAFAVDSVYKNYKEQSIVFFNGDIRRGAKITIIANRTGVADATYTITPHMQEFETAGKLQSLKFGDALVPNFRPDVYNYMINVTTEPTAADFTAVDYNGNPVSAAFAPDYQKKKQVTFTVSGGETYSICWFYAGDEWPFTYNWVQTNRAHHYYTTSMLWDPDDKGEKDPTGYKPQGWSAPADLFYGIEYKPGSIVSTFTYYTGKEVTRISNKELILSTLRGGALNASCPGAITLGKLSIDGGIPKINGNLQILFERNLTNGVTYRNTPEQFTFDYQPIISMKITKWNAWLMLGDGSSATEEHVMEGTYNHIGTWQTMTQKLSYTFIPQKMNIMLCAGEIDSNNKLKKYNGSESYTADLQIRNMRMVYNSKLDSASVNGAKPIALDADGRTFRDTVGADEVVIGKPTLKFKGAVHDQMQVIEWLNDGEWINGDLIARVINYGENSLDSTHYYVVLHRAPEAALTYTVNFEGLPSHVNAQNDTTFVKLPFATTKFPEVKITPDNIHQRFAVNKEGNNVIVIVTNELNVSDTMTYVFREEPSNVATPANITAENSKGTILSFNEGAFVATTLNYTINGTQMPFIKAVKEVDSESQPLNQIIDVKHYADSAIVKVTAEDGKTTTTYIIKLIRPVVVTNQQIAKFYNAGQEESSWAIGGTNYFEEMAKPDTAVLFERCYAADAVTFIQTHDSMEWRVAGNTNSYVRKYPTDPSANNLLKNILVAGVPLEGFEPTNNEVPYPVPAETTEILEAVAADDAQTIETTMTEITGGVEYEITVTAQNKTKRKYTVRMTRPLSPDSTLTGILLDSVMIDGFAPNVYDYTVTLPIAKGPKKARAKMPNLTYVAANNGQTIGVSAGELNGDPTTITVTAEDEGASSIYTVTINEELSSCTELTDITINGKSVDPNFEPGRHFYSTTVDKDIVIGYTHEDRFFQKVDTIIDVIKPGIEFHYTLRVTAEDGTQADYLVEIYVQNQSNDAQLANILLDNVDFLTYKANAELANPQLPAFDPGKNDYTVKAPIDKIPNVSGQLKMADQKIETTVESTDQIYCVHLKVTAVDGVTTNEYKVTIDRTLPQLNRLTSISIDGDTIKPFDPDKHSYIYDKLADGAALPEIEEIGYTTEDDAIQNDSKFVQITRSEADKLITIVVHAQDTAYPTAEYNVSFLFRKDTVNTLEVINETRNGMTTAPVNGWDPKGTYFHSDLPIGEEYPEISYGDDRYPGDGKWPRIDSMTVSLDTINLTWQHQTIVTAQDGSSRTYTVSYRKLRSNVTTLNWLKVSLNGQDFYAVEGFNPEVTEYNYTLKPDEATALEGRMPILQWEPGDIYQTIDTIVAVDSMSTKSLDYKHIITVTAATGRTRNYTVHYPVELSTDATLRTIKYNNGGAIPNFDGERENYKIEIEKNAEVPNLIPVKNVEGQKYEQDSLAGIDTIRYFVWAEDRNYTKTYTIAFERMLSTMIKLNRITLTDTLNNKPISHDVFDFKPEQFDYTIILPYDSLNRDILPRVDFIPGDMAQTVWPEQTKLNANQTMVTLHVVAENEEYGAEYNLIFQFTRNNDTRLKDIKIHGEELADFNPLKIDYEYKHPYGTDSASFFKAEDVEVLLSDIAATYQVSIDEDGAISIVVTAQDGVSQTTYTIIQTIGLDGDNFLEAILLHVAAEDGTVTVDTLRGFDPEITFYTYLLPAGATATPTVEGLKRSPRADVSVKAAAAGDTCIIICTAQDLKERRYYVYFKNSDINVAQEATGNDVVAKCLSNTELFVGTIRKDVHFALFDEQGHRLFYEQIPTADPNDAVVVTDLDNKDVLTDIINSRSGLVINITPGKIYFYTFIYGDKTIMQRLAGDKAKKLKSGKIITRP